MTASSDDGSSLFRAAQKQRIENTDEQVTSLEQHLEMLFSDSTVANHTFTPRRPVTGADSVRVRVATNAESNRDASRSAAPATANVRETSRWFTGFLGTSAILVLMGTLLLSSQVRTLSAKDHSYAPAVATVTESLSEPAQKTPEPTRPHGTRSTPTIVEKGGEDIDTRETSAVAAIPATHQPRVPETPTFAQVGTAADRLEDALPTGVPDISPSSTPTATYSPAKRVLAPTTTPVPAYSIGLSVVPTPVPSIPLSENAITIVLLGSDQRPHESAWRTDVIIIVSIDPKTPSVSVLSIPRDTWLYIPNWTYQRINLADAHGAQVGYPGGGPGLVKATIEYNFGIHVDYFARVDFAGLINIVDSLGGIEVLLDCPVEDGFPDDPITEDPSVVTQISYPEPGVFELDGKHALWLSRSRKTTSEFARSRRQHRVLNGIWAKANELGFIPRLPELWDDLTGAVETDLSLDDVLWLASVGLQLSPSQVQSGFLDGQHLRAWVTPGGGNVLLPQTEDVLAYLATHFTPYPFKAPQGYSRVEVWNGSGHADWGLLAADRLLRNGFEVVDILQTEKATETSVLDFTTNSKGSPVALLERIFGVNSVHVYTEPGADGSSLSSAPFRLVVGSDFESCERPAAARWIPTPTPAAPAAED